MGADQFYGSNNLEKYPNGKLDTCKKCITMHVDNFNPDTYMWILQECDVPYVPDEWHKLLEKYAYDRDKLTGMTIRGRYLSKMKLKQHKDYRWKDTAFLQEMADTKKEQAMKRQGYDAQEIALQLEKDRQREKIRERFCSVGKKSSFCSLLSTGSIALPNLEMLALWVEKEAWVFMNKI